MLYAAFDVPDLLSSLPAADTRARNSRSAAPYREQVTFASDNLAALIEEDGRMNAYPRLTTCCIR